MLSRTADHLYWMARYTERAENLARLLDVTCQLALVPQPAEAERRQWQALLILNSLDQAYNVQYKEINSENVLRFLVRDETNPSSIYACLRAARENARAVRSHLTAETWETYNTTWLEVKGQSFDSLRTQGVGEFFEWVKQRTAQLRGVTFGTMMQDESLHFIRLGGTLERADNTARLLDVKFNAPADTDEKHGATDDYYHWGAVLRAVSAFEVYRKAYRDVITPARVAELLMLQKDMPRSLASCVSGVDKILGKIANSRSGETQRRIGLLNAELRYARMEDILAVGLHQYLTNFMDRIYDLGNRIARDFLMPAA